MTLAALPTRVRGIIRQGWRDLLSVYYANTPVWRWLKSGALLFLGFFLWSGGNVLLSVKPGWTILHYVMAYGLLLIVWGPFTHIVVVPLTIRLRRTAEHPLARTLSRNSGKINLTIFFILVIIVGTITPGFMLFEFSPSFGGDGTTDVSGDIVCEFGETAISCHVEEPQGIDYVEVTSGGETLATADQPPYAFEIQRSEVAETRTGKEFVVTYRNEDGERLRRYVRTVP